MPDSGGISQTQSVKIENLTREDAYDSCRIGSSNYFVYCYIDMYSYSSTHLL